MNTRQLLVNLGKLLLCGFAYFAGLIVGSMVVSLLKLHQPPMPESMDQGTAAIALLLVSPILALALALTAKGIAGDWLTRTLILSVFTYVAYIWISGHISGQMTAYRFTGILEVVNMGIGTIFLGVLALILPVGLLRSEARYPALVARSE